MDNGLSAILAAHHHDGTRLVQILRDLMARNHAVSRRDLTDLADALGLSRAHVEGVAGFYAFFSSEEGVRYRVLFSDNITDEFSGSRDLMRRLLDAFRIEKGETSRDGRVHIDTTSCTGLCDQGPAMLVNGRAIGRLTPARIGAISALIRSGSPVDDWPENLFTIHSNVRRTGLLLGAPFEPGEALAAAFARGAEGTLTELKASGLRGRGGAGFATATKWDACLRAEGTQRVIVCNADEGEPGTFKDRELLTHHVHGVLEGMTVAASVVSAQQGFLYLRGEYPFLVEPIRAVLEARRKAGLLGRNVLGRLGFDFDVDLHVGAGAYVCGEESALLESLEGRRGIPRNRPPFPVTHGYLGRPTVVNNVETLLAAAHIALRGGAWFRAEGTPRSAGSKILSVSGDVAHPGTYEFPFGTPIRRVLEEAGAVDPHAVQVGGPSGVLLAAHEFDRKLAFEDVPSAGAFMVFDRTRDVLAVVENFARFFAHESCGFCTPCRVGTTVQRQIVERVARGRGSRRDLDELQNVARVLRTASHCGLGTTACNPVSDLLAKFRPTLDRRLASTEALPTFDLEEALSHAREVTARDDPGAHLHEEPS